MSKPCLHCKTDIPDGIQSDFCCSGCKTVYELLRSQHLDDGYYALQDATCPVGTKPSKNWTFLDSDSAKSELIQPIGDHFQMTFYIEGIHCAACIWVLEQLQKFNSDVLYSQLDLGAHTLKVGLKTHTFSAIAALVESLGYTPFPLAPGTDVTALNKKTYRRAVLRLGVSGFVFGNIMLLYVAIYAGLSGSLLMQFHWISLLLILPAITFSAWPFYKSAFGALRNKLLNIDFPVSLAILLGFILSVIHLIKGINELYFDSIAGFIFLLSAARFLADKWTQKAHFQAKITDTFLPQYIQKKADHLFEYKPISQLLPDDIIQIDAQEKVPTDCQVIEGQSQINQAFLTGESKAVDVKSGDKLLGGSINESEPLIAKVLTPPKESYLATLLNTPPKTIPYKKDKLSAVFVLGLLLSISGLFLIEGFSETTLSKSLAMIIVACPCAIALAVPLGITFAKTQCHKRGILIQNEESFFRIPKIETIFWDKTGTLTKGELTVDHITWEKEHPKLLEDIATLESHSQHPIAFAIQRYTHPKSAQKSNVQNIVHLPGLGIEGSVNNRHLKCIKSQNTDTDFTMMDVFLNNERVAQFYFSDTLKPESLTVTQQLKAHQQIVSGDNPGPVEIIAKTLQLDWKANVLPHEKQLIVENTANAMMIGDGLNDSTALQTASVGIAIQGSLESSLKAADIILSQGNLMDIPFLFQLCNRLKNIIRLTIGISLAYNLVGLILALFGFISPLAAAILMPVSSLTVLIIAAIGIGKFKT